MSEETEQPPTQLPEEGAGQRLLRARQKAGLSVEDIAGMTRITVRHLELIEAGDFAALPARTYAFGFSRTYAKAVGLDEHEILELVRAELGEAEPYDADQPVKFAPGDPARVPSRGLAWFSLFALVLLVAGGLAFFRDYFLPASGPGPIAAPASKGAAKPAAGAAAGGGAPIVAADPKGPVVFTSLADGVWVRFYEAEGERLIEKSLNKGETYQVPATAKNPQIWTGQPEALDITIGGKPVGKLSGKSEILRDIPVTPAALLERVKKNNTPTGEGASEGAGEKADEKRPAGNGVSE